MHPHAFIIAGPNGAGKTTFAREFLPRYAVCRDFLNADLLAAGLSPFDPDGAAVAAGRLLLARMKELIEQEKDFGFETTLAGKTYAPILQGMRARGYRLKLFYLWLPQVELAVARVANRVRQGGHNIPEDVIRRRFAVGKSNLLHFYLPLFDAWILFDNSACYPRIIARHEDGRTDVCDTDVYGQIVEAS
jgi:predicted ABC-type ATPase